MTRVAIIGAGPSGMAQLRAFQSAQAKGAEIPELVCFEKQSDWGGQWNYTWHTGMDEHGEPVHSSMYRYLWSNGPKECLEFADYTFDEHFGRPIGSYPPREVLWDYIKGRVEKANVRQYVRFHTVVRYVSFDDATQLFSVTVHDYADERTYTETFDYVVVASGHFSTPRIPEYPGFEKFGGRILHAHDFRDALEFKNKNVLIVGSSYSAEDIGSQCYKYGAKNIISCYRSAPMGYKWPENWSERPQLTHVNQMHAYFQDGSSVAVDAIILCTGYLHHFPFIESSLSLRTNNILYPLNLYQGVVWEQNPKLFYLGMQDQWYSFNMFDAQAWFARDVMLGRIELPSLQEMQIDTLAWHNAEKSLEDVHAMYKFQGDYIMRLIEQTDYPTFDIEGVRKTFMAWKKHKKENIMTFRDHTYCSLMTGTQASPHHTTWLEALDDSLDAYLHVGSTVKQKVG